MGLMGDFDRRGKMTAADGGPMTLEPLEYALIIDNNAQETSQTVNQTITNLIAGGTRVFISPFTFIGNRLVDNGDDPSAAGNAALDSGDDLVVLSDEAGLVVDRVVFDTATCRDPADTRQDISLERKDPLGPGDCTNFVPSSAVEGSPGLENAAWMGLPIALPCTCINTPPPTRKNIIITEILFDPPGANEPEEISR
jgi:hypothetical protein